MELWLAKLLAALGLSIVPFIATILPIKVYDIFERMGARGQMYLSWLMCFGGGVFFGTFMLEMGPEVREILDEAVIEYYQIEYPLAEFLVAMGFFVVLFMEKFALAASAPSKKPKSDTHKHKPEGDNGNGNVLEISYKSKNCSEDHRLSTVSERVARMTPRSSVVCVDSAGEVERNSRSLLLALALSLHRIFGGMSVGLKTSAQKVGSLFVALIVHEPIIGFSLGLQFVKNRYSTKKIVAFAAVCSCIIPIGVAIGTLITELGGRNNALFITNGVLQAFSTGCFVYVTFFEILQDEITHSDGSLVKVLWILVGFGLMAGIIAIPEGEHGVDETVDALTTVAPDNYTQAVI